MIQLDYRSEGIDPYYNLNQNLPFFVKIDSLDIQSESIHLLILVNSQGERQDFLDYSFRKNANYIKMKSKYLIEVDFSKVGKHIDNISIYLVANGLEIKYINEKVKNVGVSILQGELSLDNIVSPPPEKEYGCILVSEFNRVVSDPTDWELGKLPKYLELNLNDLMFPHKEDLPKVKINDNIDLKVRINKLHGIIRYIKSTFQKFLSSTY